METCIIDKCQLERRYKKIGLCYSHYQMLYKMGYRKMASTMTRKEIKNIIALTHTPHMNRKAIDI